MIDELKNIWDFDPLTMVEIKSYIIPLVVIIAVVAIFWILSMHGHQFNMGPETVPFTSGHSANGDVSIFGADGYHFNNE